MSRLEFLSQLDLELSLEAQNISFSILWPEAPEQYFAKYLLNEWER